MLKIPLLWIMIHAVVMCAISLSFLDPTLADHLASFKLTPSIIGLMFLLSGGIYTITAPFWSIIIDKFNCSKAIILFGIIAVVIMLCIFRLFKYRLIHYANTGTVNRCKRMAVYQVYFSLPIPSDHFWTNSWRSLCPVDWFSVDNNYHSFIKYYLYYCNSVFLCNI
ncbi:putative integral membrane protein [Brugia pahangi]